MLYVSAKAQRGMHIKKGILRGILDFLEGFIEFSRAYIGKKNLLFNIYSFLYIHFVK